MKFYESIKEVFLEEKEIKAGIKKIAKKINKYYKNKKNIVFVGALKGCVIFMAHLTQEINFDFMYDFVRVKRTASSGKGLSKKCEINWITNLDLKDKNVLIVEDIIDSGTTLQKLINIIKNEKKASDVKTVTLIDKRAYREIDINSSWTVFTMDKKEWVAGWGFDISEQYRNTKAIGYWKDEFK